MFFFFALTVFAIFMLCLSPILVWAAVPARWHLALGCVYAAIALVTLLAWARTVVRGAAQRRNSPVAAGWRWPPGTQAELFRRRIELFLAMRGWHIERSSVVLHARVELIIQKERYRAVLLFAGPGPPPAAAEDIDYLQRAAEAARATFAAIVTPSPCGPQALAAIRTANLLLLQYADIDRLDEIILVTLHDAHRTT